MQSERRIESGGIGLIAQFLDRYITLQFKFAIPFGIIGIGNCKNHTRRRSRDFGLGTELDWLDTLTRIYDTPDPVERERKLDLLKWDWLEEHTFFHYFSMERLLALLLKLDIVERWAAIDPKRGGHMFRELVERLRNEAEIPQEFKK